MNPYDPPAASIHPDVDSGTTNLVPHRLRWPAIGIIGLASLNLIADLLGLAEDILWPRDTRLPQFGVPELSILGLVHGVQMIGGFAMLRMTSWRLANASAVTCCIPCMSPFWIFGIPFGIWAANRLWMPDTKSAFDANTQKSG